MLFDKHEPDICTLIPRKISTDVNAESQTEGETCEIVNTNVNKQKRDGRRVITLNIRLRGYNNTATCVRSKLG